MLGKQVADSKFHVASFTIASTRRDRTSNERVPKYHHYFSMRFKASAGKMVLENGLQICTQ